MDKITALIKNHENLHPFSQTLLLTANKQHSHHRAELIVKTPQFSLSAHDEKPDMYVAIDSVVDKMVKLIKKEKEKARDKNRKGETEKSSFAK
jgi:ribosomal subunit interface protein